MSKIKYGVQLDEEKTKTGSAGSIDRCPSCGGPREIPCPKCGTQPYEKKPESVRPAS